MNIQEACELSQRTMKPMYRKSEREKGMRFFILPTNDATSLCLIVMKERTQLRWQPSFDDLIADDWEVPGESEEEVN